MVALQQKEMEAVTVRLNEQAAEIQKPSAQLEARKPAPQVVTNPPKTVSGYLARA